MKDTFVGNINSFNSFFNISPIPSMINTGDTYNQGYQYPPRTMIYQYDNQLSEYYPQLDMIPSSLSINGSKQEPILQQNIETKSRPKRSQKPYAVSQDLGDQIDRPIKLESVSSNNSQKQNIVTSPSKNSNQAKKNKLQQNSNNIQNKQNVNVPSDFLTKVRNAQPPSYNLQELDTHPPTKVSTQCNPSPSNTVNNVRTSEFTQSHRNEDFDEEEKDHRTLEHQDDEEIQREALIRIEHDRILEQKYDKRRRQKKSKEQLDFLEHEYLKNPKWDHPKNIELALRLKLTVVAVRKWNWDRRKKDDPKLDFKQQQKTKVTYKK